VMTALRELPARAAAGKLVLTADAQGQGLESGGPVLEALETNPALKKLGALKNQLVEKVRSEPAGASQLVQSWLREGGVE